MKTQSRAPRTPNIRRRIYDHIQLEEICASLESIGHDEGQRKVLRDFGLLIARLFSEMGEVSSTIRGHNGHDGLVARVATIEERMADVAEMQKKILDTLLKQNRTIKEDEKSGDNNPGTITFQWILERVVLPGILPVAIGLFVFFSTQVMPKLLVLLENVQTPVP